jgi:aquaporin Z
MKLNIFLAECIGTFALVFFGAGIAAQNQVGLFGVAVTFGGLVTAMIYLLGEISGTNINPAVTLALALNGDLKWSAVPLYWAAQFLGGIAAGAVLLLAFGNASNGLGATRLASGISPLQGLVIETLTTFFLMLVVFLSAPRKHAGLIIGPVLVLLILFAGPLTNAGLNPARTLGPAIFSGTLGTFWLYLLGPLVGAALAVPVYRLMRPR